MSIRFPGLTAAPFTAFHPDFSLNLGVIPAYAAHLRSMGVRAVFVCGTTGEGASLTSEERRRVAEAWAGEAGPDLRLIVHVGHTVLAESRDLSAHAAAIGASAIATVAPYFFKPRNIPELVAWCAAVAGAAPGLPFYYYNIPSMTGVFLPVVDFLQAVDDQIPSLAGIKYTHEDLADYAACLRHVNGRYDILFGRDELLLEGLGIGASGVVGSTYNYAAPLYLRLIEAHRSGNQPEARRLQDLAVRMIAVCNGIGVTHLAASKALMGMLGVDCGPVRPPLLQPAEARITRLRAELEAIGFFTFSAA